MVKIAPSSPLSPVPPHPSPLPRRGEGTPFLAPAQHFRLRGIDGFGKYVLPLMGARVGVRVKFGWRKSPRPPLCPRFPLTLALSHGGERGFAEALPQRGWGICLSSLSPALSRRRGIGRFWLVGCR